MIELATDEQLVALAAKVMELETQFQEMQNTLNDVSSNIEEMTKWITEIDNRTPEIQKLESWLDNLAQRCADKHGEAKYLWMD